MSENKTDFNASFAQLELALDEYFKSHMAAAVVRGKKEADKAIERDARLLNDRMRAESTPFTREDMGLKMQHAVAISEGHHSAHVVVSQVMAAFRNDPRIQEDIATMVQLWRATAVAKLGEKEYLRISNSHGGDLAAIYFCQRVKDLVVQRLAKEDAPKSDLEYIAKEGIAGSMWGFIKNPVSHGTFLGDGTSRQQEADDLNRRYETLKDYFSQVSPAARADAHLLSMVIDGASVPGGMTPKVLVTDFGVRTTASAGDMLFSSDPALSDVDRMVGQELFGDEKHLARLREVSSEYYFAENKGLRMLNQMLNNKFFHKYSSKDVGDRSALILKDADGSSGDLRDGIFRMLNGQERFGVPEWMNKLSLQSLEKNADFYLSHAKAMKEKGARDIVIGNKRMTYEDVCLRARQYDMAIYQRVSGSGYTSRRDLSAIGSVSFSSKPPEWMLHKDAGFLHRQAAQFTSIYVEMKEKGLPAINFGNTKLTLAQVAQKAVDYSNAAVLRSTERQRLKPERQNTAARQSGSKGDESVDASRLPVESVAMTTASAGSAAAPVPPVQQEVLSFDERQQSVASWDSVMDSAGLGGLGDLFKNFGHTISMLPDMLLGMFTGRSRGMKVEDNLLPIAAIFGGLFFGKRNPMLKLMLLAFGGMGLMSNANKALNGGPVQSPVRSYGQPADEPLNARLRNVEIKADEHLMLADVDGRPVAFSIGGHAIDAYTKGVLPLNTLANAVLRKLDEQGGMESTYRNTIAEEKNQERTIGIR